MKIPYKKLKANTKKTKIFKVLFSQINEKRNVREWERTDCSQQRKWKNI